jgi:hypothetical protein
VVPIRERIGTILQLKIYAYILWGDGTYAIKEDLKNLGGGWTIFFIHGLCTNQT